MWTQVHPWQQCLARTTASARAPDTHVDLTSTSGTDSMTANLDTSTIVKQTEVALAQMGTNASSTKATWRGLVTKGSWSETGCSSVIPLKKALNFHLDASPKRPSFFTIRPLMEYWGWAWAAA